MVHELGAAAESFSIHPCGLVLRNSDMTLVSSKYITTPAGGAMQRVGEVGCLGHPDLHFLAAHF